MPDTITTAVPQQAPPQDAILHPAQVYFLSRRLPGIVHLVQYDQTLPVLAVELYEGDEPYTVPEGAAVNIRMAKPVPSTKKVYNPAYGISSDRHTVYIQVTPQMTVVAGCTNPVIEVVVDGGIACTGTLRLEIDPNPVQESDIIDTDEYKTLEEILAEAQAAAQIVADNEQALQDVHNNLAAIQNAAANAQAAAASAQDAEDAADRAAIEAQKALGFRSFYGGQVLPEAETGDLDPSRPMTTPTAASVTIKARGDRIAGLTMAGKTTQAGTGDPSPKNIRRISGVGMYDQCVVLDGSNDENLDVKSGSDGYAGYAIYTNVLDPKQCVPTAACCSYLKKVTSIVNSSDFGFAISDLYPDIVFRISGVPTTDGDYRAYLQSHPLIIWYRSVDFYKSKGPFYTVVELSQDPYRAVGFELTQPLFDGDTLQVGVPSGCDKQIKLDGSAVQVVASGGNYAVSADDAAGPAYASGLAGLTVSDGVIIIPDSSFPASVTNASTANSWLQDNPQTVFYRSTSYSQENDIRVALESHTGNYLIFDGTETVAASMGSDSIPYLEIRDVVDDRNSPHRLVSSVALYAYDYNGAGAFVNYNHIVFGKAWCQSNGFTNIETMAEDFKSFLTAQYTASTPVQVVYELATPITYARPVPTMIAQPGEDGTFTVAGENSLSVLLKAFQDGGDAATLNGKKWQVFEIDVPASAWTGSGTNYTAAIALSGMTAELNVVACALGSSYVGANAAEQAMAQWDYLETGANTVTFHAAVKPTANFGVVLTTVS